MAFAVLPALSSSVSPVPANGPRKDCRVPDPLLLPYLQASDADAARALLDRLIHQHADPIIAASISRYTRHLPGDGRRQNADDVRGEAICNLLARVDAVRRAEAPPIGDFRAYVKQTASTTCWRQARKSAREISLSPCVEPYSESADATDPVDANDTSRTVLQRELLRRAWEEILLLPAPERTSLLLSCRDATGSSGVSLWMACGTAQPIDVATALGIDESAVKVLVDCLPLDDKSIAQQSGKKVQDIINLRFAARRRLLRRLSFWLTA